MGSHLCSLGLRCCFAGVSFSQFLNEWVAKFYREMSESCLKLWSWLGSGEGYCRNCFFLPSSDVVLHDFAWNYDHYFIWLPVAFTCSLPAFFSNFYINCVFRCLIILAFQFLLGDEQIWFQLGFFFLFCRTVQCEAIKWERGTGPFHFQRGISSKYETYIYIYGIIWVFPSPKLASELSKTSEGFFHLQMTVHPGWVTRLPPLSGSKLVAFQSGRVAGLLLMRPEAEWFLTPWGAKSWPCEWRRSWYFLHFSSPEWN